MRTVPVHQLVRQSLSSPLTSWQAMWVQGVRHGVGRQAVQSGEVRYGVWREGVCEGCVVNMTPIATNVFWHERARCLGEATPEQIQAIAALTAFSSTAFIHALPSIALPPLQTARSAYQRLPSQTPSTSPHPSLRAQQRPLRGRHCPFRGPPHRHLSLLQPLHALQLGTSPSPRGVLLGGTSGRYS